jgi:hypothetical protein
MPIYPLNHVNLNIHIYDPIETDEGSFGQYSNTIGFNVSGHTITEKLTLSGYQTNTYLQPQLKTNNIWRNTHRMFLKRNGPYGYPSWKQIRAGENNISRFHRKNNILTFVNHPVEKIIIQNGKRYVVSHRDDTIRYYDEPPIVAKHKPLEVLVSRSLREGGSPFPVTIKVDFNNGMNMMTNKEVNAYAKAVTKEPESYNTLKSMYLNGALEDPSSPISGFSYLKFSQTIFPAEKRTFKFENRVRVSFPSGEFWKDKRYERSANGEVEATDSDGFYYNGSNELRKANRSVWPLDVSQNWATRTSAPLENSSILFLTQSDSTGIGGVNTRTDYGILQNNYNMVVTGGLRSISTAPHAIGKYIADGSQGGYTRAAPLYNRKHSKRNRLSVVAPSGRPDLLPSTDLGADDIYAGEAAWDAPAQAGRGPFDDNIEVFAQHTKSKYKNYGIIPEYKINSHIDFYLENGTNKQNLDLFELPGGGPGGMEVDISSETDFYKIYSTSDFLENFNIITEDHKGFADPSSIKLTCNAVLKLIPYDGFYPAQRTVDLAESFYSSYRDNIYFLSQSVAAGRTMRDPFASNFYDKDATKPFLQPLFSPGVLFNTIKSGIAVDHAIHNDNLLNINFGTTPSAGGNPIGIGDNSFVLNSQTQANGTEPEDLDRIPFEALLEPEEYLKNKLLYQQEPDLNSSWDIRDESNYNVQVLEPRPIVWDGQGKNNYKKMINNFLAETPEFFLENKTFTTYRSLRQDDPSFGNLKAGVKYAMRVAVGKTTNEGKFRITGTVSPFDPYEVPSMTSFLTQSFSSSPTDGATGKITENITMYSRPSAFGPDYVNLKTGDGYNTGLNPVNTPPYYDGAAWTHIEFEPSETRKYTCKEILNNSNFLHFRYVYNMVTASLIQGYRLTSTFVGMTPAELVKETTLYNEVCMHNTASLNIFNIESKNEGTVLFLSGGSGAGIEQSDSRLTIQAKFETPILNFNNVDILTIPQIASASVPRGMWHQYGSIPTKDEMIYLEISDVPAEWYYGFQEDDNPRESLADALGFEKSRRRLGELAKSKTIKEAVVAVPFYDESSERKFFRIPRIDIDNATGNEEQQVFAGQTIIDMVNKMKQYNFPPPMDFLTYKDVDPFAMYIFEFEHVLDKQDLSYIWQNLIPDIGLEHKEASATITHELLAHELLGGGSKVINTGGGKILNTHAKGDDLNPEIRWMVFKVKYKAKHDYYEKIIGKRSKLDVKTANINYNWPYDFFSLVELVKLDASVEFSQIEKDELTGVRKLKPINSPNPMPVTRNFRNGIKKK